MKFPPIHPIVAALQPLERRLVSPRIPFMKIFALGCDRQFGIRGGIVNVPVNVRQMFETIPINPNQANVIHLKLKRKNTYESHYLYERIRPKLIYEAAKILWDTPLYKTHDPPITLQENWELRNQFAATFDAECDIFTHENVQRLLSTQNNEDADTQSKFLKYNMLLLFYILYPIKCLAPMDIDGDEQEIIPMEKVDQQNVAENDEVENFTHFDEETLIDTNNAVQFAPGEGEIPLAMWLDENCEELAFPHIFGGRSRQVKKLKRQLSYNALNLNFVELIEGQPSQTICYSFIKRHN